MENNNAHQCIHCRAEKAQVEVWDVVRSERNASIKYCGKRDTGLEQELEGGSGEEDEGEDEEDDTDDDGEEDEEEDDVEDEEEDES